MTVTTQTSETTVSVLVPAYNCAATIRETLDSVLAQSTAPLEILVMDDGSSDGTYEVLRSYEPRIMPYRQPNGGPSRARNALVEKARGDLIVFLDSDDVLHPLHVETQVKMAVRYPEVVAFFAGHVNFEGQGRYDWQGAAMPANQLPELMTGLEFFERFNWKPGAFASCSFCSVRRTALAEIGAEPFNADGAEDFYCFALLSSLGSILYNPTPTVAYRMIQGSHSSNRLTAFAARVHAFELLKSHFLASHEADLREAFGRAFASHRRSYGKHLIGAGRIHEGRQEFIASVRLAQKPASLTKSIGVLLSTYLPAPWQPAWPTSQRAER